MPSCDRVLDERLREATGGRYGFRAYDANGGSGDCLFATLSTLLCALDIPVTTESLRADVGAHIRALRDADFLEFLAVHAALFESREWHDAWDPVRMRQDIADRSTTLALARDSVARTYESRHGHWGTGYDLDVLCARHNVTAVVFSGEGVYRTMSSRRPDAVGYVLLHNIDNVHFQVACLVAGDAHPGHSVYKSSEVPPIVKGIFRTGLGPSKRPLADRDGGRKKARHA